MIAIINAAVIHFITHELTALVALVAVVVLVVLIADAFTSASLNSIYVSVPLLSKISSHNRPQRQTSSKNCCKYERLNLTTELFETEQHFIVALISTLAHFFVSI